MIKRLRHWWYIRQASRHLHEAIEYEEESRDSAERGEMAASVLAAGLAAYHRQLDKDYQRKLDYLKKGVL